jgi:small subunit ribosomal protein S16
MAVKIRLQRFGRKKKPFYRIVAADESSRRDGKVVAYLGFVDPKTSPPTIKVDEKKLTHWLNTGATPTATIRKLLSL